ncbi:hypothetical protein IQ243_23770 [Nostocales cyanobacterium LEGE 11386]|jgi:hypothetical protein|nr:hypothetical protein [Nostocales cyanobacterium LEGE 11386]MBW4556324.1 hypothetical protein [Trichormus sp. ATA11-4-KO1]
MFLRRCLKLLHFLGWEFWLPLPLLGIVFWSSGNLLAEKVLSRPYGTVNKLQTDAPPEFYLPIYLLSVQAEVNKKLGVSEVVVKAIDPTQENVKFQFPVTDISQLENAIARELGMSIEEVRKLVRYQIND